MKTLCRLFLIILLFHNALAFDGIGESYISKITPEAPLELEANKIEHSETTVEGEGKVVLKHGQEMVRADKVTFFKDKELICASGDIKLVDNYGQLYNAENFYTNKSFTCGGLNNFNAYLTPKGLISAEDATLTDGTILKAHKVKYTLCDTCKNNFIPYKPFWSVESDELLYNQETGWLYFTGAKLKLYDQPIFIAPYLVIPTPKAEKKSGFLTPIVMWNHDFGLNAKIPFYINIRPNMDATITPWVMQRFYNQISGEFRHLTPLGQYNLVASAARSEKFNNNNEKVPGHISRSHIAGHGLFKVRDFTPCPIIVGFDGTHLHDPLKTYLKKYKIDYRDILTNHFYTNYYTKHSFTTFDVVEFQGLRNVDNPHITPQAYPLIDSYSSNQLLENLFLDFKGNFLNLYRNEGINMQRALATAELSYIEVCNGHKINASLFAREDMYNTNLANPTGAALINYEITTRTIIIPPKKHYSRTFGQASLRWGYPLASCLYRNGTFIVIEPNIEAIAGSKIKEGPRFANEDSQAPEVSMDNLFVKNIFQGYDRIEDGLRIRYSLKTSTDLCNHSVNAEIGQSRRFTNQFFPIQSGLHDKWSDIVTRVDFVFNDNITLGGKIRFNHHNLSVQDNELSLLYNYRKLSINLDYYALGAKTVVRNSDLNYRQELDASFNYLLTKSWNLGYVLRTKLGPKQIPDAGEKLIAQELRILYLGNCLDVGLNIGKDYTKLKDLTPLVYYQVKINVPF